MESRYSIIDLNILKNNFRCIQKIVGSALIMPIVKANAYGHGLIAVAQTLQAAGAHYVAVAFIAEAIALRKGGITLPILVLGSVLVEDLPLFFAFDIDIIAPSIERLQCINACAQRYRKKARVHLKIDTGLGRIGVRAENAEKFFSIAICLNHISIIGVMSHFATADDKDTSYMIEQCEKFYQATIFFEQRSIAMPLRHVANSAAILQCKESFFDMVRPGILLYGIYPQAWMKSLLQVNPIMSLHARIVYFKVLLKQRGLGYGLTWKKASDTRIITIPVGYGDGYPRALSNKGYVLMKGERYPIVGTICMDQMMIDIADAQAYVDEEVTLIGKSGEHEITINDLANWCAMSPYELMVSLNNRIVRYYKG